VLRLLIILWIRCSFCAFLFSPELSKKLKFKLCRTLILPVVMDGHGTERLCSLCGLQSCTCQLKFENGVSMFPQNIAIHTHHAVLLLGRPTPTSALPWRAQRSRGTSGTNANYRVWKQNTVVLPRYVTGVVKQTVARVCVPGMWEALSNLGRCQCTVSYYGNIFRRFEIDWCVSGFWLLISAALDIVT
jgi:hypothetical protein